MADSSTGATLTSTTDKIPQLCDRCMMGNACDPQLPCDYVENLDTNIDKVEYIIEEFEMYESSITGVSPVPKQFRKQAHDFIALQQEYKKAMEYHEDHYNSLLMIWNHELRKDKDMRDRQFETMCRTKHENLEREIRESRIAYTAKSDPLFMSFNFMDYARFMEDRFQQEPGFYRKVKDYKKKNGIHVPGNVPA
ncbi:hypothetical protein P171DRAFT_439082 [Karstenula rhodostoma CBS 690.94]|uniref:Uncharacterized protein n=1 Tax=Karstenula rhodostoma CBS 690.94 TaxID=1392251 RepID=A0A9P4PW49_9PLEO|nr:hypothetical protein P171DRAFT_439082 [Karstenula rhodostoma CBS 690.94]